MELFLIFAVYGVLAGLIYLIGLLLRGLSNYNLFITIVLDFACGVLVGTLFMRANIVATMGDFKIQFLAYFVLGIAITIITFKNLVASISKSVYNKINKAIILLNNNKRRKKNGCTETPTKS